ncbi:DUF6893 family small protein [Thermostaphylospora chromogena]|uniref:Uncharacterized protein n=1 Tax=Thermostaphylospora chromogena TaxID=35622 RepID=A0A1H1H5Z4_9ACTN|nr:hypothetical protein SAMN04489764_4065 [Thermostaphylospora chromogena]
MRRRRRRGPVLALAVGIVLAAVVWREMPSLKRYLKIRQM